MDSVRQYEIVYEPVDDDIECRPHAQPAPASLHCEEGSVSAAAFRARMEAIPAEHRPYALAIYANAVRSQLALREAA